MLIRIVQADSFLANLPDSLIYLNMILLAWHFVLILSKMAQS